MNPRSSDEHPDDALLLALAEEEPAPEAARAHLAGCAACAERVQAYRAGAAALATASPLTRAWCPPRPELLARAELPTERAARVERHLTACPLCRDDLRDLAALEGAPEPAAAPGLAEVLRARVALGLDLAARALRVLESSLPVLPEPALAVARGAAGAGPGAVLQAPFGEGSLELTWAVAGQGADLRARALGAAPRPYRLTLGPAPAPGAPLEVWESRTSDDAGRVTLAGLAPGRYVLQAFAPRQGTPELEVEVALGEA